MPLPSPFSSFFLLFINAEGRKVGKRFLIDFLKNRGENDLKLTFSEPAPGRGEGKESFAVFFYNATTVEADSPLKRDWIIN